MSDELRAMFEADKSLPVAANWEQRDSGWFRLSAPLDIGETTIEGLSLTGSCQTDLPDESVALQLVYNPIRKRSRGGPLVRIEWRPLKPHNNKNRGPEKYRNVLIKGSHVHPFDLNWNEAPSLVRRGNLPIAVPLPFEPATFEDFLAFAQDELRISDLGSVQRPNWGLL